MSALYKQMGSLTQAIGSMQEDFYSAVSPILPHVPQPYLKQLTTALKETILDRIEALLVEGGALRALGGAITAQGGQLENIAERIGLVRDELKVCNNMDEVAKLKPALTGVIGHLDKVVADFNELVPTDS